MLRHSWQSRAGPFSDSIALIRITSEEESPSRYNCLNWRQVLRGSGVFEYGRQALPDREGLHAAYRTLGA